MEHHTFRSGNRRRLAEVALARSKAQYGAGFGWHHLCDHYTYSLYSLARVVVQFSNTVVEALLQHPKEDHKRTLVMSRKGPFSMCVSLKRTFWTVIEYCSTFLTVIGHRNITSYCLDITSYCLDIMSCPVDVASSLT